MKPAQIVMLLLVLAASLGIVVWLVNATSITVLKGEDDKTSETKVSDEVEPVLTDDGEIDYYPSNPFRIEEVKLAEKKPVAVVDEKLFKFGRMILGTTQSHDFVIRNTGDAPLKMAKGRSQCKCTVSGLATKEIAPGEEASIQLSWTPKTTGAFTQGAIIWTNDPENTEFIIEVEGDMYTEIVQEPENNWVLGTLQKDEPQQIEGAIFSSVLKDFKITGIESSSEFVEVDFRPMSPENMEVGKAISGFEIFGTVRSDGKAGKLKETITVTTNSESHPSLTYTVTATKPGPLQVVGPGWYANRQLLDLGTVSAADGKTQKLIWMVVPGDQPLEIKQISANPPFLKVSLTAATDNTNQKRERYTLTVEIPPNADKGNWPLEQPGNLILETNHAMIGKFEIEVALKVH